MPYTPIITHDIDFVTKFKSLRNVLSAWRRGENSLSDGWQQWRKSREDRYTDPYWSMLDMMEVNQSFGIETHFYFKTAITNPKYDWNDYKVSDPDIKVVILELKNQGATIGLHPSYETYLDGDQIKREKDLLEEAAEMEIIHSRQHFLRYKMPETFRLLAQAGIKYDSSIKVGGADCESENGKPYEMTYEGENLGITQLPFLMMETHELAYPDAMLGSLERDVATIRRENGTAMVIWHNNSWERDEQRIIYNKMLRIIS